MTSGEPVGLTLADARCPARLRERFGANAPAPLSVISLDQRFFRLTSAFRHSFNFISRSLLSTVSPTCTSTSLTTPSHGA